ncbi:hypothetical protein [Phenylobacterium sp.]|uniref:hypothetical protein n=1 Tax=Phenylobacterium sp. TaxID=1871053 RepID=UPI00281152D7|nr:hypothetical protein [Phenylobacterium sp.]
MSKSKKKAKGGGLPKRIAGVKVPKAVRRGRFADLLASRQGQALIAEAILGAGAVAAGLKAKDDPKVRQVTKDAKDSVAHAGGDAATGVGVAGATLAYALAEGARAFAEALRRGGPTEPRSFTADAEAEAWTPDYGAPESAGDQGKGGRKKQPTAQDVPPL